MKKRVLSMLLAFTLCFSTLPMTALAQEADVVAEQEETQEVTESATVQEGAEAVAMSETPAGENTAAEDSDVDEENGTIAFTDESVSDSDAGAQGTVEKEEIDPAVQAVQTLIDALPDEVTAENAESISEQLAAIDEAMDALDEAQIAKLNIMRLENIYAALNAPALVATQAGEHTDHAVCGKTDCSEHTNETWTAIADLSEIPADGSYYLTRPVNLTSTWTCGYNVKLCLNGNTIKVESGKNIDVINVQSGKSLDITDCRETAGEITHASGATGRGIYDNGTLTLWNGTITGNISEVAYATPSGGGGVYVAGDFTMNGGKIAGNSSIGNVFSAFGGGVNVDKNGTFTMTNGRIEGNTSVGDGGGVNVFSGGTMTMSGGTITGNNTTNDNSRDSGGVYVGSNSQFIVSGSVQIQNNYRNGTLKNGVYEQGTNGTKGNLYLTTDKIITIEKELTQNARIGVSVSSNNLPTLYTDTQIATSASNNNLDYTKIFSSDVADQGYRIERSGTELYIKAHQHSWKYMLDADGKTITAACANISTCPKPDGGSVTIKAPEAGMLTYDGKAKNAGITVSDDWQGPAKDSITVSYKCKDGTALTAAPANAGTYTASITFGDVTASVDYTIKKAVPKVEDFKFPDSIWQFYDGHVNNNIALKPADGVQGMGRITMKYYQGETEVQPINAGDYTVRISVEEGDNYTGINELKNDDWKFTIQKNNHAPSVKLNDGTTYIYTGERITPEVTVTVDDHTLTKDVDYTITYGTNVNAGENAGTVTIRAKDNYAFTEVTENFTIEQAEQRLRFTDSEVTRTYGDADFSIAPADSPQYYGAVTYASNNTDVATVNENTGEVTIVGAGKATITATAAATTNYKEGTASYTLTVDKATIRIGSAYVKGKRYNGNKEADVSSVSLVDRDNKPIAGLVYGIDYTAVGEFLNPNAGQQTAYVKVELLNCAQYYKLEEDTFTTTAVISAMPVSLGGATAESRIYERNDTSVKITKLIFRDYIDEVVTLTEGTDYTVTGKMSDANAGENKNVIVTVQLLNGNYSLSDKTTTTTVTILRATPVINAVTSKTLMKNGAAVDISGWASFDNTDEGAALTYTLEGTPAGITLTGNRLTAANTADTVKEFKIKVSAEPTVNFEAPVDKTITVTVVEKEDAGVQITGAPSGKTYGDADFTLTAIKTASDGGTWSWSSSNPDVLEIVSGGKTATPTIRVKKVGTATLMAAYSDNDHYGSDDVTITVEAKRVTADMIGAIDTQTYTGSAIKPEPAVKDRGVTLASGTDFDFGYQNNINAGENTATLTITGRGNYTGTASRKFTITPKDIKGADIVLEQNSFVYTGLKQTVKVLSVTLDGITLTSGDYEIAGGNEFISANDAILLTVKGKGNYTGEATTTWKITRIDLAPENFEVMPDLTGALTYDGSPKTVNVRGKDGFIGIGTVTVYYEGISGTTYVRSDKAPTNAGEYKVTASVTAGTNYNAIEFEAGTLTIHKAAALKPEEIREFYEYTLTGEQTINVANVVAGATGYALGAAVGDTGVISGLSVDRNGIVKFTLNGTGVVGNTVTLPLTITSVNYEDSTVNVVIVISPEYRIIDGADSSWTQNTDGVVVIRGNGEITKFRSVRVDGKTVDAVNYTVTEGSTIITLKADYLKTLSQGSHSFEIVWEDGKAATSFTVASNNSGNNNGGNSSNDDDSDDNSSNGSANHAAPTAAPAQEPDKVPATGDLSGIWMTLFAIFLAGFAGMLIIKKKDRS